MKIDGGLTATGVSIRQTALAAPAEVQGQRLFPLWVSDRQFDTHIQERFRGALPDRICTVHGQRCAQLG